MMHFFGYANEFEGHEMNRTGFFEFPEDRDQSLKDKYFGYKTVNEASLKKCIEISKDPSLVQEF